MVWTCDADGKRQFTQENVTYKNGRKRPRDPERCRSERGKLGRNTRELEVGK
jgi:hypothetical protein